MLIGLKFSFFIMIMVFIGSVSGGLVAQMIRTTFRGNSPDLLLFCGGILAGLLMLDLIPETIHTYNSTGLLLGGALGILFMYLLHIALQSRESFKINPSTNYSLLFVALLFHGIPTGIALGMSEQSTLWQNPSLLLAIILHHLPEGMIMMTAVNMSKLKIRTFFLLSFFLSFSIMIPTFLGGFLHSDDGRLYTLFLGAAVGTLSYITFYEILWKQLRVDFIYTRLVYVLLGMLSFYGYHVAVLQH